MASNRGENIAAINQALAVGDQRAILNGKLAEARRQGIMAVAKRAGVTRGSLYSALGDNGNPTLALSLKIMAALDLRMIVAPNERSRK